MLCARLPRVFTLWALCPEAPGPGDEAVLSA